MDDLSGILRKVQALIAKADGTDNQHEAEAFRAKADALMFKYRIEESTLPTQEQRASIAPIHRTMNLCSMTTHHYDTYWRLAYYCLKHVDALFTQGQYIDFEGQRMITLDVCGYESDLAYAELLFTSFSLAFGARMEARVDPSLTDQENAYNLRMAGWDGGRVAAALWGINDKSGRSKARRFFEAEARARGEDPSKMLGLGNSMDSFRASYESGFVERARQRLRMMKTDTSGVELVLASRKSAVEDLFYERHPSLDHRNQTFDKVAIGGRDTCAKCKAAKSGHCRDHPRGRSLRRSGPRFSAQGWDTGAAAADAADIRHTAGTRSLS